jgi:hypothetical protein
MSKRIDKALDTPRDWGITKQSEFYEYWIASFYIS